jgi:hypothetical protein
MGSLFSKDNRMADDPNAAAGQPQGEVRPDGQAPETPGTATPDGGVVLNPKEWSDFRRELRKEREEARAEMRQLAAKFDKPATPGEANKPASAPAGPATAADVDGRMRKLEIRAALAESGVTDPELREVITDAIEAKRPDDIHAYVAKYARFGAKPAAAPAAAPAAPNAPSAPPGRSNTGAPGSGQQALTPQTLAGIDPDVYKSLPIEERRRLSASFMNAGAHQNPNRRIR